MNNKIGNWFLLTLLIFSNALFGQEQEKRLNFALLIDNDIPIYISQCYFLIHDSTGKVKDTIPFSYGIGRFILTTDNYQKLFSHSATDQIYIDFQYNQHSHKYGSNHFSYNQKLPGGSINKWYTILKIHNYSLKEGRENYTDDGDGFAVQILFPGGGFVSGVLQK